MSAEIDSPIQNAERAHFNHLAGWGSIQGPAWENAKAQGMVVSQPAGTKLSCEALSTSNAFVVILSGIMRLYSSSESGRELCLGHLRPGDICPISLGGLLGSPIEGVEAITETEVTLFIISADDFHSTVGESHEFRKMVMAALTAFLNRLVALAKDVCFDRLPVRMAKVLLKRTINHKSLLLKITHQDVANEIGTTREVASRLLKELETMDILRLNRGMVVINTTDQLQQFISQ